MKRLLLTSIVAVVCSISFAQIVKIDKIEYKIENGEAWVSGSDKDIEVANIRSSVEYKDKSYPVTRIGPLSENAFSGFAFAKRKKLSSVSIPSSVTSISHYSFWLCKSLQEIIIPNTVKFIGLAAFGETPLRKIIVPDLPMEIKRNGEEWPQARYNPFYECINITDVKCHNGGFPTYILAHLPQNCPFMLALKYQQVGNNNNMYAQNVQQAPVQNVPASQPAKKPSSDVDVNLPSNATNNDKTFAVIFASENYAEEVNVEYALNDGEVFKEYCHKVLGLPEENVHIRKDATLNNIKAEVSWMQQVAKAYNGQARFIVFYAGHGIPDEASKAAYLLPVDGKGSMLDTGYSLAKLYEQLGNMPAERVTVFMDACFSGSKRGEGMLASARGVAIKAKPQAPKGKMVVFSAASGDETAYPLKDKEHGLYTYYLLKKLKDTKGDVTYGELGSYITEQVSRKSIVSNGKSQSPTVTPSQSVASTWKTMKLK